MMTLEEYERLKTIDITAVLDDLKKATVNSNYDIDLTMMYAAYMLVIVKEHPEITSSDYWDYFDFIPQYDNVFLTYDVSIALTEPMDEEDGYRRPYRCHELKENEIWNNIYELKDKYDADTFKAVVLFGDKYLKFKKMPESLALVVNELIDLKKGATIVSQEYGVGTTLSRYRLLNPDSRLIVSAQAAQATVIGHKQDLLGLINPEQDWIDQFDLFESFKEGYDFYFEKIENEPWDKIKNALENLSEDGKIALIVNRSNLQTKKNEYARRVLLENGYLETVINLPIKLFEDPWKQTSLLVISRGNKTVSFVNAEELCTEGRLKGARINYFKESNAKDIAALVNKNTEKSVVVSNEEILNNGCVCDASRYLNSNKDEKGIRLGDLAISIKRAASIPGDDLVDMISVEPTELKCLTIAKIKDGIIDEDALPYLKNVDPKYKKFVLEPGDVLLAKNGSPFKAAVCETGNSILANGNLYIIRIDHNIVDPYYLKAFLLSNKGQDYIESHHSSDKVHMISITELEDMIIPIPKKAKQKEITVKCQQIDEEIKEYQRLIKSNLEEVNKLFE